MGLIEDYSKLLVGIQTVAGELQTMKTQLVTCETSLADLETRSDQLVSEQALKESALLQQQLSTLTAKEQERIRQQQQLLNVRIQETNSKLDMLKRDIMNNDYRKQLNGRYRLLEQLETTLAKCHPPDNISDDISQAVSQNLAESDIRYTDKTLKQLQAQVEASFDEIDPELFSFKSGLFDKVVSFVLLEGITDSKMSNKNKMWLFVAYMFFVLLGCIMFPAVPIIFFSVAVITSYRNLSKENSMLLDCTLPYAMLQEGVRSLKEQINAKRDKFRSDAIEEAVLKSGCDIKPLLAEQADLEQQMQTASQRIRDTISDAELKQMVAAEFASQIDGCSKEKAKLLKEIHKLNSFIRNDELNLPKLRERQKNMLVEIKEAYLNPTVPGTSLTLTESFFLGIDEMQGTLIEFKFGGKTTLIMYKGHNCHTNKALVTMMLMQLLSSMSMTVLDVYLTDQVSAGTDYAVFFQKELQDKMHLCATENDTTNAIKELHEALILRTKEILTEAPSLTEYNEAMLSRKSLPREYIFFLLQDPTDKQMADQNLQQILVNGPVVGIIPIIFINHKDVNDLSGLSADSLPKIVNFFKAFHGSTFIFDGVTNDLTMSDDLDACIVDMLERGKKGKGK